ncbi:hypothetical protein HN873_051970 [Arachis hypogaea]
MKMFLCDSTTVAVEPFQGMLSMALPWRDLKSTTSMEAIGVVDLIVSTNVAGVGGIDGGWEGSTWSFPPFSLSCRKLYLSTCSLSFPTTSIFVAIVIRLFSGTTTLCIHSC